MTKQTKKTASIEYTSQYGTLIVGEFDGTYRHDTWISASTGERFSERAFATGPHDKSNIHNSSSCYGGSYDSRCSCCYLNFNHTEEAHRLRLK